MSPKPIWTYPVTETHEFSSVAYSEGGCVDKFCWKRNREGMILDECEHYEVKPDVNNKKGIEFCNRDKNDT